MAAVTRLGLYGGPRAPYGSFAGRTTNVVVEETTEGGGKSKRRKALERRKYPRWVVINGQRYRVNSPEEERQLLQAMLDRAQEQVQQAEDAGKEPPKQAKKQARLLARRIEKAEDAEAAWLRRLREMDEELIILLH